MENIKRFDKFISEDKLETLTEDSLNERFSSEQKLEIVQKLEEIELFVYENPKPKPGDIRRLCNELVDLCGK